MASQDGIGAPRKPSTVEREASILREAIRLRAVEQRGLRYEDAARVCTSPEGDVPTRKQVNYSLQRLANTGKLVRRDGYVWYLGDTG
jgi:hypothetical protein